MQPNTPTPQKQVMDVTAPQRQPSPDVPASNDSQSLPVHAAPEAADDSQETTDSSIDNSISQQDSEVDTSPIAEQQLSRQPKQSRTLPVAAITLAIFAMLGLSAIAIMIYLNS